MWFRDDLIAISGLNVVFHIILKRNVNIMLGQVAPTMKVT